MIGVGGLDNRQRQGSDVVVGDLADADLEAAFADLWEQRLVPFEHNLRTGRRAAPPAGSGGVRPGPGVAEPSPPTHRSARSCDRWRGDPDRSHRLDIGAGTSGGKDLIDIQVVVTDLDVGAQVANAAVTAGFVRVSGGWFGEDRAGELHVEEVAEGMPIPADRSTSTSVRSTDPYTTARHPVAQDWLRESADGRGSYQELKRRLAAHPNRDVNDYSVDKMPWIRSALATADRWATETAWIP